MKKVKLKQLTLNNFRGHTETEIKFSETTIISGANGTGKSTIFDAFLWLLFGKDQFERKDFEIIPIIDNKMLERVDTEVIGIIEVDGREITLTRILHQKWVRRRGTAEEIFDGCETLYQWDGVPLKAGEYKARVDLLVEETIFKLTTNPSAFLSLHWTKQREFLFQIAGTVSDNEIASNNPNFAELLDMVNGKSLVEFKKELSARKKKLKDELDDIQPRIDQTVRLTPQKMDFDGICYELEEIEKAIKDIENELFNQSKAINTHFAETRKKQAQIQELRVKQSEIISKAELNSIYDSHEKNKQRINLQNDVSTALQKLNNAKLKLNELQDSFSSISKNINAKQAEIEQLREEWDIVNTSTYQVKNNTLICPIFNMPCTDSNAISKNIESNGLAEKVFYENQQKQLVKLNEEGLEKAKNLEALKRKLNECKEQIKTCTEDVDLYENEYQELSFKINSIKIEEAEKVIKEEIPEWQELETKIKEIESSIKDEPICENTELLSSKKSKLTLERDKLKEQLAISDKIEECKDEVDRLEKRGSELAQQIANLEKTEFTINAFNKVKIDECDRRVNGLFSIVKFKLFDTTLDGNEFEACIATNKNGVPITVTNTAEQINAGLDIIRTLSNFYNVQAPIFIDRCESVNEPINTGAQMILVRVTEKGTKFKATISNN